MRGKVLSVRPCIRPRVCAVTGTPVSESPKDSYEILKLLAPEKIEGISRGRWDQHFVIRAPVKAGRVTIKKAIAYANLEELKRMLEASSVRRLKVDVRGMPPKTEDVRYCDPTEEQREHYRVIMEQLIQEIEGDPDWAKTLDFAMVKILRARQVLNHPGVLGLSGDSGKHKELDNIVEELMETPEAKLVIWCEWNTGIDLLAKRYSEFGVLTIDQRTSQADLARMDKTFDYDENRIVVASPSKGGTGIDFLSRARIAVYVERPYSLVLYKQSVDRIVRRVADDAPEDSSETRRVKAIKRSTATILYLQIPGSVDEIVASVLQKKIDLGDALLTTDERLLADGREDLLQMLKARAKI